MHSERSTLSHN